MSTLPTPISSTSVSVPMLTSTLTTASTSTVTPKNTVVEKAHNRSSSLRFSNVHNNEENNELSFTPLLLWQPATAISEMHSEGLNGLDMDLPTATELGGSKEAAFANNCIENTAQSGSQGNTLPRSFHLNRSHTRNDISNREILAEIQNLRSDFNHNFKKIYKYVTEAETGDISKPSCLRLETPKDVRHLDTLNKDTYKDCVKYFRYLGGNTLEEAVKNCFCDSMTEKCSFRYSMFGTNDTYSLFETTFTKILFSAVYKKFKPTKDEFKSVLSERLRSSKQSYRNKQQRKTKSQKSLTHERKSRRRRRTRSRSRETEKSQAKSQSRSRSKERSLETEKSRSRSRSRRSRNGSYSGLRASRASSQCSRFSSGTSNSSLSSKRKSNSKERDRSRSRESSQSNETLSSRENPRKRQVSRSKGKSRLTKSSSTEESSSD